MRSKKYFAFHTEYGYCVVVPQESWYSWYYGDSIGPDTETNPSSNTVRCNAGLFYTDTAASSNFVPTDSNTTNITATYTYNGNGTGSLTLEGTGTGISKAAKVLLGSNVSVSEDDDSSTSTESTLKCTITVNFSGDMSGLFTSVGTHNGDEGGQTGDFVLYRTSTNISY